MRHVLFVIAALSLLFGCASREPAVKVVTQEVKVPVREVCIKPEKLPLKENYVTTHISRNDSNVTKTKKLIVHYKQSEMYIKVLQEALKSCSE